MNFEVEQKFRVADLAEVERRLVERGAVPAGVLLQADRYFRHPARDFAQTDEALRIRQVGEHNFVTYKGPKIDAETKTRRELEFPLHDGDGAAEAMAELLVALGFSSAATVRKHRWIWHLAWQDAEVEIALDRVENVGEFAELELPATEETLAAAKTKLLSLAAELNLTAVERRSYLELLLEAERT